MWIQVKAETEAGSEMGTNDKEKKAKHSNLFDTKNTTRHPQPASAILLFELGLMFS